MNILGYPHTDDGSGYYRFYQPFKQLGERTEHNVVLPEPGYTLEPNDALLDGLDMIVGQRMCGLDGAALWKRWRPHAALVYEVDDDILRPTPALPQYHGNAAQWTVRYCLRRADLVTTSTEPLAEQLRVHNRNVIVLPNHIHEDLLTMERPRRNRVTVGWAGGFTHQQEWPMIAHVLHVAAASADVHVIGWCGDAHGFSGRFTLWQDDVWNYYAAIDFDIGIAPLAETPFNTCKSHIRALEYMALGIPVIASDVPAYQDLVVDGVTGYLVSHKEEWRKRLTDLIHDQAMRDEMGAAGREVARKWTIQQGWTRWRDAYWTVTG